jgi:uncharacterized protein (UPF0248 family)
MRHQLSLQTVGMSIDTIYLESVARMTVATAIMTVADIFYLKGGTSITYCRIVAINCKDEGGVIQLGPGCRNHESTDMITTPLVLCPPRRKQTYRKSHVNSPPADHEARRKDSKAGRCGRI